MEFRIEIADVCALIRLNDDEFANQLIEERYNNFLSVKNPSLYVHINVRPIGSPSLMEGSQVAIEHSVNGDSLYFKGFKGFYGNLRQHFFYIVVPYDYIFTWLIIMAAGRKTKNLKQFFKFLFRNIPVCITAD